MTKFICVQGEGYGTSEFTLGSGGEFVTQEHMNQNTTRPMCWAGLFRPQLLEICQLHQLQYYNLDSAYFGNGKRKHIVRLSINSFQNVNAVVARSADRWEKLKIIPRAVSQGSAIVVVPPDRKTCNVLGLGTVDKWVQNCCVEIRKHTDREIKIRTRPEPRSDRIAANTFVDFIQDNTWCVVGHSSNALVEAAMCDIPVIALGDSAVNSLYRWQIQDIDKITPAYHFDKQA